jgi:hypothetical protein
MRTCFRLIPLGAAALAAVPAQAALAPHYQRQAELRAVIAHPAITRAFGSDPIDRVEYLRADLYRVSAGRCRLDARSSSFRRPATSSAPGVSTSGPGPWSAAASGRRAHLASWPRTAPPG